MACSLDSSATHCQICLEDLVGRDPRALQCLHTFCFECLQGLPVENVRPNCREMCHWCHEDITGKSRYRGHTWCPTCTEYRDASTIYSKFLAYDAICCPTCRNKTTLPKEGVKGLPANFLINEISDILGKTNVTQRCQYCKSQAAVCFCENCVYFMCEKCKAKHNKVKQFGGHIQRSLDAGPTCELHDNKAMYFCQECKVPICVNCVLSQAHHTHSDDIQEYLTWANSKLNNISKRNDRLKQTIYNTECKLDKMLKLNKNYCETILAIDKAASVFNKAINDQAETMKMKVNETQKKQEVAIETMRRAVEDYKVFSAGFICLTGKTKASEIFEIESKLNLAEKSTYEIINFGKQVSYHFSPGPVPVIGTLEASLVEGSSFELFWDNRNDPNASHSDGNSGAVESEGSQKSNCNSRQRRHSVPGNLVLQHLDPMPCSGSDTRPKSV